MQHPRSLVWGPQALPHPTRGADFTADHRQGTVEILPLSSSRCSGFGTGTQVRGGVGGKRSIPADFEIASLSAKGVLTESRPTSRRVPGTRHRGIWIKQRKPWDPWTQIAWRGVDNPHSELLRGCKVLGTKRGITTWEDQRRESVPQRVVITHVHNYIVPCL